MEQELYLFLVIYEEVLDGEVSSLIDSLNIDRYIKWDRVKGEWREKHMGTHVWPGEYHVIAAMVGKEEVKVLKDKVRQLQRKFPADEIWGWVISLEEII